MILHGQYSTRELVSKFLIAYFNPATDSEINQILGIFFSALASRKKQDCLADALVPTLKTLIDSPYDSPLREVKIETVIKFVVNLTLPVYCSNGLNLHNMLSMKLLEFISENIEDREVTKVLPKELMTLEISDDPLLRKDLIAKINMLIENTALDVKSAKLMKDLKSILEGTYKAPLQFSSTGGHASSQKSAEGEDEEADMFDSDIEEPTDKPAVDNDDEERDSPIVDKTPVFPPENDSGSVQSVSMVSAKSNNASQNSTLVDETKDESLVKSPANDESLVKSPAVPKTPAPAVSTRRSLNKRQIYTPRAPESPHSPLPKKSLAASFTDKTMLTPRTPNFTLPNSKVSTPNTDRQTRSRARAVNEFNSTVTRSKSASSGSAKKGNKSAAEPSRASRSQTKK